MSKKPIEFLEDLRREFRSVCDTQVLHNVISIEPMSVSDIIDLAWCYYFGSPNYKAHLRRTYGRRVMGHILEITVQVKVFIETIKRFHSDDEFQQLTSAYCQSIEENRVVLSVKSIF
ncbi:MAG: hypothetical protein [Bacteriophage sp.]|nr:MAG: hypothetical protein [Bacteriophage sp.]